jgi:hypothetical protein
VGRQPARPALPDGWRDLWRGRGHGFAALETALYGVARVEIVGALLSALWLRALLSPFTHGCWTAIVCAAIWRRRALGIYGVPATAGAFATAVWLARALELASVGGAMGAGVDRSARRCQRARAARHRPACGP